MTDQTGYDATLDPRTGRPVLPLDAENARKSEAESAPLTDEDNQGIWAMKMIRKSRNPMWFQK